ncbi:MAG: tyrosine-type recombinase/integrase [Nitrospirae bacterium]|nr:tyrosine-type recombinase/integrase [Nitrospirota bacterium]
MKSVDGMRLFKREDNGIWYVQLTRTQKRSLQTRDEREAKMRFIALQREAVKGKLVVLDRTPTMSLQEFVKVYLDWCDSNRANRTRERADLALRKLTGVISKNKLISDIRKKDMDDYVAYCTAIKNKPTTINIEIRHIKAAFSWAVTREYLKVNPLQGYSLLKVQKVLPRFLTIQQIEKVFQIIETDTKYKLVFALYVYTGARREEIHRLQWSDIKNDTITIKTTKNYLPRIIPICDSLKKIISEHPESIGKVYNGSIDHMASTIKAYLKQAGMSHIRPHDLRHTFASQLIMSGVDLRTVQELLGHTTYNTTQIYAHLSQQHLEDAIKKLPY